MDLPHVSESIRNPGFRLCNTVASTLNLNEATVRARRLQDDVVVNLLASRGCIPSLLDDSGVVVRIVGLLCAGYGVSFSPGLTKRKRSGIHWSVSDASATHSVKCGLADLLHLGTKLTAAAWTTNLVCPRFTAKLFGFPLRSVSPNDTESRTLPRSAHRRAGSCRIVTVKVRRA